MITRKLKIIFVQILFISIFFVNSVFATEFEVKTTKEYDEWNSLTAEEKEETLMPRTIPVVIPKEVLNKYNLTIPKRINYMVKGTNGNFNNVGASITDSKFSLTDKMDIRVEHQKTTNECWAFSTIKSLETNIALLSNQTTLENFSERHMDYSLSQSFLDGENPNGLSREVSDGGLPIAGLSYLISGKGAVLEKNMPFEDNQDKIKLSDINQPVDTIATGYTFLPIIQKTYSLDSAGNTISVRYYDTYGIEYTPIELEEARSIIKEHLIKYGAISSMNGGNYAKFYSNPSSPFSSKAYNCNDSTKERDHAVTIVGWDDNYSRNNFAEGAKPSTDGAYLVLNSYGSESFDNGYMYISYEDMFIEEEMYGITSTSKVDYDNIYEYDDFGGIFEIGSDNEEKGYIGNVFYKKSDSTETLKSVGVTIPNYNKVNIYVNPENSDMDLVELTKVYSGSDYLTPGYHRIDIKDIDITGSEFAVVIEQISEDESFYFSVEAPQDGTSYKNVDSEGESYFSTDGHTWTNLNTLNVSLDAEQADVCIKAFTSVKAAEEPKEDDPIDPPINPPEELPDNPPEEPKEDPQEPVEEPKEDPQEPAEEPKENPQEPAEEPKENESISISSDKYTLNNNYIMGVTYNTKIDSFLSNINTNSTSKTILDSNTEITNSSNLVKTGMKLRLSNGDEYVIIVKGDIKEDGKITLTDLSKLIAHYNEIKNMELKGNQLKAADMNIDGKVNLVDISQMVVLYNSI